MRAEYRCPECGALQNKKDMVKGECWKCERAYKESEVNGAGVLVEDNSRGVLLGHDTDEDIKADISFKCSYCDIEVTERMSDGHHTYWHEPCNRSTRIIVSDGYMRHRELIEEETQSEKDAGKSKSSENSTESQTFGTFKKISTYLRVSFKKIGSYLRFSLISSRRIAIALILFTILLIAALTRFEYQSHESNSLPIIIRIDRWTGTVAIWSYKDGGHWVDYKADD